MITATKIKVPKACVSQRIASLDWPAIDAELDTYGAAAIGPLLTPEQCEALIGAYDDDDLYRTRIVMARHGFGRGEYKYFTYPLPPVISELREGLYPHLATIANR